MSRTAELNRWTAIALAVVVLGAGGTATAADTHPSQPNAGRHSRSPHTTAGAAALHAATAGAAALHAAAAGAAARRVIAAGLGWRGVRYVFGGDSRAGIDCSAFTRRAYRAAGVELPRVSADQARTGRAVASLADARPGDLLAWDNGPRNVGADHVGIYLGGGKVLHAPRPGSTVHISKVADQPGRLIIRREF